MAQSRSLAAWQPGSLGIVAAAGPQFGPRNKFNKFNKCNQFNPSCLHVTGGPQFGPRTKFNKYNKCDELKPA